MRLIAGSSLHLQQLLAVVLLGWLFGVDRAQAAARAHADAEAVLEIASSTPGSTLNFVGSGVKQVGALSSSVYDSLNRLRIAGAFPTSGVNVPMSTGQKIEIDIQAGVRTDSLSLGQSAEFQIDIYSNLAVQNTGAIDAIVTFAFEREYFLHTFLDDTGTVFGQARGEFSLLATSYDSSGVESDRFSLPYEAEIRQGVGGAGPQDHFNFELMIPAGGSGSVAMHAMARSQVAIVPEPGAALMLVTGAAMLFIGVTRFLAPRSHRRNGLANFKKRRLISTAAN